jgi:hypothetical protein
MRKRSLDVALVLGMAALAASVPALAKETARKKPAIPVDSPAPVAAASDPADVIDATPFRDKLLVVSDGKGHYLAAPPDLQDEGLRGTLFYSADGKSFYQQRVPGYGSNGPGTFSFTFWEPRVGDGWKRSFERKDGNLFEVQCDDRLTRLTQVPAADAKKLLADAKFLKPRWKYRAYALARDDSGRYFYVDVPREPETSKAFRLYMGRKNELKPLKMTNVVSDSKGDIFATKSGELRLIIPKDGQGDGDERVPVWIKGKAKVSLTWVPIEDNGNLIYAELGVYTGQSLGTPCDDL